ncbi:MAG: hypothetical protein R3B84_22890 [Zavarzinella sp.]
MKQPLMARTSKRFWIFVLLPLVLVGTGLSLFLYDQLTQLAVPEAVTLKPFVATPPEVPIIFTSRTNASSLEGATPEGEGFTFPGTIPWAAPEGRLRRLDPNGKVYELTWGRPLPDGTSIIDVMSPSITLDGKQILFAGRKSAPDHGHWRIFRMDVDGDQLEQITGLADDPGCIALPPMRFATDGTTIPEATRKQIDYDDIDPCDRGNGEIIFASSRIPDLGRDHARRATQIWHRSPQGAFKPLSANRNNDRWPILTTGEWIMWSNWSRNREAVTADGKEIRPLSEGGAFATQGTDQWMSVRLFPDGMHFGYMVKIPQPVWRSRPLFNGNICFMSHDADKRYRLFQAPVGYLRSAPSSLATETEMPAFAENLLQEAPTDSSHGALQAMATPSPSPGGVILFAGQKDKDPTAFGIYQLPEQWAGASAKLLFDDPNMVDSEPVAIYRRKIDLHEQIPAVTTYTPPEVVLQSGRTAKAPFGEMESHFLNIPLEYPILNMSTDAGQADVVTNPNTVKKVVVYGAHRDRFDSPEVPRIKGHWEKLLVVDLNENQEMKTFVPADPLMPTVIAGLDANDRIVNWTSPATDKAGKRAKFYATAGDHYSGTRANGYVFCNGCHTGHTFLQLDIAEK